MNFIARAKSMGYIFYPRGINTPYYAKNAEKEIDNMEEKIINGVIYVAGVAAGGIAAKGTIEMLYDMDTTFERGFNAKDVAKMAIGAEVGMGAAVYTWVTLGSLVAVVKKII